MVRSLWIASCMCGVLLLTTSARAERDPPRIQLTVGGALGTAAGIAGGASLSLALLFAGNGNGSNEWSGLGAGALGLVLSAAALPFCTAAGVKIAARKQDFDVSYGKAAGGAWLGAATMSVFLLPMAFGERAQKLAAGSLIVGLLGTLFVTMPLMSTWLASKDASRISHGGAPSTLALGYGASF